MRLAPSPARDQRHLREQIRAAEDRQDRRRGIVEQTKAAMDESIAEHDRIIANLKAQLTIGVAP